MANQHSKMAANGRGHGGQTLTQDGRQWKRSWWATSTPRWPPMEEVMVTDPPKMAADGRHYNSQAALQDGCRWKGSWWATHPRWLPMEKIMVGNQHSKMAADGGQDGQPALQDGCQWKRSWCPTRLQDGRQWRILQRPISSLRWLPMEVVTMANQHSKMAADGSQGGQAVPQDGRR